ncbi:MAG: ribosome silencing factor [Gammaproteobacteria bacterium]|nr:ribosome silencing factor [Gammaproteobacteria bacterium]
MSNKTLSKLCNQSLIESKADDILFIDVKGACSFTDEIIIATASSNRHAVSVLEKLVTHLKKNKINIIGTEGEIESGWMLVDCGDIVVNIMKKDQRDFYDLESLWGDKALLTKSN